MARSVSLKVGGKTHKLVGSFAAGERVSTEVADLMIVQREASLATAMAERGLPYTPRWQMGLKDMVNILEIACDESGASVDRADIEAECFKMGFDVAHNLTIQYLQLFFAEPDEKPEGGDADAGK